MLGTVFISHGRFLLCTGAAWVWEQGKKESVKRSFCLLGDASFTVSVAHINLLILPGFGSCRSFLACI